MNSSNFNRIAKEYFGSILEPEGFSSGKSKRCGFYRKFSDDIFHIVIPDLSSSGEWYDIKVYGSSPLIEPEFESKFPDELVISSGTYGYLHPVKGVGIEQRNYRCRTEDSFIRSFEKETARALSEFAIPYLNNIETLEDLIPHLRVKTYLGAALIATGRVDEGRLVLKDEYERISKIDDNTGRISKLKSFIESKLSPQS